MTFDADSSALMRPNDVARVLAVSRAWVYEAARSGRIPSIRIGGPDGPLRFVREDIERWINDARAQWTPGRRQPSSRQGDHPQMPEPPAHAPSTARSRFMPRPGQESLL